MLLDAIPVDPAVQADRLKRGESRWADAARSRRAATDVSLIYVPFMAGDPAHPVSEAPVRYAQAGAELLVARLGRLAEVHRIGARPPPTGDHPVAPAQAVARALHGVAAGLDAGRTGVVWVDAHADFNTPRSSASGFFPGMSLAVVTGQCHRRLWASLGGRPPIPEELVVLAGVRSLSPAAEARRLARSAIRAVPWENGSPAGDLPAALDALASRADRVYLHIDNDAFDPQAAPGVVDEPVPGGLSLPQMEDLIRAVTARMPITAATIATYTPARDRQNQTLAADLRILELIAQHAASS